MNDCVANEYESKLDEITQNFNSELKKIKSELQFGSHLNFKHFKGQMKNVQAQLKRQKESSQREKLHFIDEIKRVKLELEAQKKSSQLKNDNFDQEMEKMKTELKEAKENLEMKTGNFEEEIRKLKNNLKSSTGHPKSSEQVASKVGMNTLFSGLSIFAVSAIKCTPQKIIMSASLFAAFLDRSNESPIKSAIS